MNVKRVVVAVLMTVAVGVAIGVSSSPSPAIGAVWPAGQGAPIEQAGEGAYAAVELLLGVHGASEVPFLAIWPEARLRRLATWLEAGLQFEGTWSSKELADVIDVLDQFGGTYGADRFVALLDRAVETRSGGERHHLRIVREQGLGLPSAAWYATSSRVVLNDGLWDDQFMSDHYSWSFLRSEFTQPDPNTPTRHVVIGHELGHVLIDGLRAEAVDAGFGGVSVEGLYSRRVPPQQRPHFSSGANEHLATEIAVWALGIGRAGHIEQFRADVLVPSRSVAGWDATLSESAVASAAR